MRLRARLLLVNAALVPIIIVGVWLGAAWLLRKTVDRGSSQSLATARAVLQSIIHERVERMALLTGPIEQDARVKGALAQRGGREDVLGVGKERSAEEAVRYLDSFMDEFSATRQDLMLLFGADGELTYGEVGAAHHAGVTRTVLESHQLRSLLAGLGTHPRGATMLWSGRRAGVEHEALRELKAPVYLVQAKRLDYHASGVATSELEGIAVLGTSDLDLDQLKGSHAGVVFVDGEEVLQRSPENSAAAAQTVAHWLGQEPKHLPPGQTRRWQRLGTGDDAVWAIALDLPELIPGPVRVAVLFSNAEATAIERRVQHALMFGALLLMLGVLLIGLWHVRSLSAPILSLAAAAKRVGEGELETRLADTRTDELGDLAREFNRMVVGLEERERARTALGRYLSPDMAKVLLSRQGQVEMGGVRRELSLLFGDIAGFTSLSEARAPEEVVQFLNQHLDGLVPILFERGAYIDKFEGDAIMAFWNAPLPQEDHAERACETVLALDAMVQRESGAWVSRGFPPVTMRWGLNTGDAVVGNLGSTHKANYTAIGDCVNLASRLEGANKLYGTRILVGEGTFAKARAAFEFRELDRLRVKGRQGGVRVYELLGPKGSLAPERAQVVTSFAEGYQAFQAQRFTEARAAFTGSLAASHGEDGPSRVLLQRALHFELAPPPPGWDGTFTASSKDQEGV